MSEIELDQDLRQQMVDRLNALYRADKFQDVVAGAFELLRDNPHDWSALYLQARSFLALNEYTEAENSIRQLLAAYPQDVDGLELMGDLCLAREEYDRAIAYYEQCIEKNPEQASYRLDIARALYDSIDWDKMYKRWPQVAFRSAFLERANRGIGQLQEANRLRPDSSFQFLLLGQYYEVLGKPEEAFENFQNSIVLNPSSAFTHVRMAYHFINQGDLRTAKFHSEQALMLEPNSEDALEVQSILDSYQQNPKKYYRFLVNYYRTLCSLYPKDPANWLRAIHTKLDYGKDQPIKELNAYLKLMPEDWEMQITYGKALYDDKRYLSAMRHFRELDKQRSGNPHIHAWLQTLSGVGKGKVFGFPVARAIHLSLIVYPLKFLFYLFGIPLIFLLQWMKKRKK